MIPRCFNPRFVFRTLITGALLSALLAAVMTTVDWRKNPSGLFHNVDGTDWAIVWATFTSWFWPSLPVAVLLTWLTFYAINYLRYQRS